MRCPVGLGFSPLGKKEMEGDGKTPEGTYYICVKRDTGKYGRALGISYPNEQDAKAAYDLGRITNDALLAIESAMRETRRPPWGTALGGEIYLHGGGAYDWTAGCIALQDEDMALLYDAVQCMDQVTIYP